MDREGRGGGLAFLWKKMNSCSLFGFSKHHIGVIIFDRDGKVWRCIGLYRHPDRNNRRETWDLLRSLKVISPLPWCIMGDFNNLLSREEKKGGAEYPDWLLNGFRDAVFDCGIIDLPL